MPEIQTGATAADYLIEERWMDDDEFFQVVHIALVDDTIYFHEQLPVDLLCCVRAQVDDVVRVVHVSVQQADEVFDGLREYMRDCSMP